MLRSLMTAVTGVRAHQTMLDVTGNNIANVNTTGFKKDITVFSDLLYQTSSAASAAGNGRGGTNPAQVGLGASVAAIETIFTQGGASYTGNKSDMMINGSGFFVYDNGSGTNLYSRSGATTRDGNADLVQSGTGYYLQGYGMEEDPLNPGSYITGSDLGKINVQLGRKLEAKDTSLVQFQCNLDSRSAAYLPYGYSDIPFNTQCGWDGNPDGTAKVSINGNTCDLTFNTIDLVTSPSATGYFSITVDDGINAAQTITFDMTGIKDGLPTFTQTNPAIGGTIAIGPTTSATTVYVDYDSNSGVLKLRNETATGEVLFQSNLTSSMNYSSFSVTDSATNTIYPIIAEFDESVVTDGPNSDLSKTSSTLTLWYNNAGTMTPVQATVYFNADGTFASVDTTASAAALTTLDLAIGVSDDGKSLVFTNATTGANVSQINQGSYHSTKQTIYDCDGNPYTMEVNFKKITENRWRWEVFLLDEDGNQSNIIPEPHVGELEFCGCGPICNAVTSDNTRHGNNDSSNARAEIEIPFSLNGSANSTVTLSFGGNGDDMLGVTQYASETTTKAVYQDGYTMGVMEDYTISADGTITGVYSNGQSIPLARVALATFTNEQGLEKVGDTMFRQTVNSGQANIDPAGVNGKGTVTAQNVEMSNVDLTEEFTHLILAQRGFQANSRVLTTSDSILEEVVNLKR